jgi:demethylmenaquinone methyltransferase / 2-methoxy-6-polyprenyl-1,4-benzoquinol methylase
MSQTKEERVHQVFESIYKRYDMMNSVISFQRHKAWRKDTMKKMNVEAGDHALDVCCGTADWTIALGEAVGPTGKVEGLDFSKNMLLIGEKKVKETKLQHVSLRHGNAMELPYEDESFDIVTIGFGLRNVPDYMQVLKEMHRVVKKGGKVVCLETSQPTIPIFKNLYFFYFKRVMPVFGKLFAKSYDEYSWLQESTMSFPNREKLADMFREAGFERVDVKAYSGGVAAMHLGVKSKN